MEGTSSSEPSADDPCAACGRPLKPVALYCPHCGHRRGSEPVVRRSSLKKRLDLVRRTQTGLSEIRFVILFYVLLLGIQGATIMVAGAAGVFMADVAGTSLMAVATAATALVYRKDLQAPYRRLGWGVPGYGLVALLSFPVVFVVSLYVHFLTRLFKLHETSLLEPYRNRPLVWAFVLVAIAPALIEETGFRGVVYGLLERNIGSAEAILISSVAFGILHLSWHSLITHVPLGLYLCWLRVRSKSIYPAMFAHFLHNSWVLLGEQYSFLPAAVLSGS